MTSPLVQRFHSAGGGDRSYFDYPNSPSFTHLHGRGTDHALRSVAEDRQHISPEGRARPSFGEEHGARDALGFAAKESAEVLHPSFTRLMGRSPKKKKTKKEQQPSPSGFCMRRANLLEGSLSHMSKLLLKAAKEGDLQRMQRAFDAGADPNYRDSHGMTAIMYAAAANNLELLRCCVARGSDVNLQSTNGCSALIHAVARNHPGAVRWLLLLKNGHAAATQQPFSAKHQVDPNLKTHHGFTALATAVTTGHLEITALLLESPLVRVDEPDVAMWTPLHHAAKAGRLDIVRLLMRSGANQKLYDDQNRSPMLVAQQYGQHETFDFFYNIQMAGGTFNKSAAYGLSRPPWVSVVDMHWSGGALPPLKDGLKHFNANADKTGDSRYNMGKPLSKEQQYALAREKRAERKARRKAACLKRAQKQAAISERKATECNA